MFKNKDVEAFYNELVSKYSGEKEYLNTCYEILSTIEDEVTSDDIKQNVLGRLFIADRVISFRVTWEGDDGKVHVNNAWRVEHNNSLGVYKGGLRFSPTVNLSILKFLALEQTFKNCLTTLPLGGAKGGADFDPKGKSENEIRRFCNALMRELVNYIGPNIDVPAGDLGVGGREIGYLEGEYKRLTHKFDGVLTGKNPLFGGSLARKEATGFGLVYFASKMLETYKNTDFNGKKVIVTGSGNVACYAAKKASTLGATIVAMSDSSGAIVDESGLDVDAIIDLKENKRARIKEYALTHSTSAYYEGSKSIFNTKCDICLPCATQNEISLEDAKKLVKNGCYMLCEGANMPTEMDAVAYLMENKVLFGPAKAANAGGVSTSGIEMNQNAGFYYLSFDEVDNKLHGIMNNIFDSAYNYAKETDDPTNLLRAVNCLAYKKLARAIKEMGY